jgi:hypothetical protein
MHVEHVPKVSPTQYKLFNLSLSEKTWIYALCLQLLLSDGLGSVVSGMSGYLAGHLYMADDAKLQHFRLPSIIEVRYMYMYIYVYICMYMYVYVCICMYMYVYICICIYMYVCIYIYVYIYVTVHKGHRSLYCDYIYSLFFSFLDTICLIV